VDEDDFDELAERPGSDLVDFEEGRVKPYTVFDVQAGQRLVRNEAVELSVRAAVLNLTDTRYAFNFGNPFSGTHFGASRTFRFDLSVAMR
jgi:outer membrane receptor protein involved in Fe transport